MKKFILSALMITFLFAETNSAHSAMLADREEMKRQLLTVDTGVDSYYLEKFYPSLLSHAGTEKVPLGIVMMFEFAMSDFLEYLSRGRTPQQARVVEVTTTMHLEMIVPKLIRAILPNDLNEAEQAIKAFNEFHQINEDPSDEKSSL